VTKEILTCKLVTERKFDLHDNVIHFIKKIFKIFLIINFLLIYIFFLMMKSDIVFLSTLYNILTL